MKSNTVTHSLMRNDATKTIIDTIRQLLKERGMSQVKLAELSGIKPSHLSELLGGKKRFNTSHIDAIAKAFGEPSDRIMGEKSGKLTPQEQKIAEKAVERYRGLAETDRPAFESWLDFIGKSK